MRLSNGLNQSMPQVDAFVRVEVVYALPQEQIVLQVSLPLPATAGQAFLNCGIRQKFPDIASRPPLGRFGQSIKWNQLVQDGDRIDILRPLTIDPKEIRRLRAAAQRRREGRR